jgi:eukaryotic-like serine/threonine-protein kinase
MPDGAVSFPVDDAGPDGKLPFQPESLLGTVVAGRYRLSGHLASGGMAAVYVAEDTLERREVALKVLQPHLTGNEAAVRRFLAEGAIAGMIEHRNVVRVLDHGERPCFIAMELLEGEGLFDRLRRQGSLAPEEVVAILVQVCHGLEAAHRQGVIHRDLKPENVFLHGVRGAPPVVKILDFGVAGGTHGEDGDTGLVVGTPDYLSPEQAFGRPADARSDVYSVGIMAWRMLAGHAPFTADTPEDMIRLQARQPVPSLTLARPDLAIPPELAAVVARACAKSPADRPQSAMALAQELSTALGRAVPLPTPMPRPSFQPAPRAARAPVPVAATAPAHPRTPGAWPPAPAPGSGQGLRLVAIVCVALALALAGGAMLLHGARPRPPATQGARAR